MRNTIGIGIIGTGFMGKAHALAYRAAGGIFPDIARPELRMVADIDADAAEQARCQLGFARATTDWRELVRDPSVDIVSITTPTVMHKTMSLAAIAAGKHVHCEKPIAPDADDARLMMEAAESAGLRSQSGFNYIKNPILKLAQEMIASGELGEITGFRGIHAEDFMADPSVPFSWRLDRSGGGGAIADIGSHIICIARFLLGPITAVICDLETAIKERPAAPGSSEKRRVEIDDVARMVVRFGQGFGGTIEANWIATGRKMQLGFEISGSKGSIAFTQERFNELRHYRAGCDPRHSGYTRIEAGPAHPPYGQFCVAAGHQLGFNDLKTIEAAEFIAAIGSGAPNGPDFREAWEIQKVIDAALSSSREKSWIPVD